MIFSIAFSISFIVSYLIKHKYAYFLFSFPGTIVHELLHFSVGLILLAKPVHFSLIPKRNGDSYTLGSVSFLNINFFNALPVSLAPLLIIPLTYLGYQFSIEESSTYLHQIYLGLFFGLIIKSAKPSSQDIKVMLESKIGILFYFAVVFVTIWKYNYIMNILNSKEGVFYEIYNSVINAY